MKGAFSHMLPWLKSTRVHFVMILVIISVGFTICIAQSYQQSDVQTLDEPFWSVEFRTALLLSLIITVPMIVEIIIDGFSLMKAKEPEIISWGIRFVLLLSHNVPILLLFTSSLRQEHSSYASVHTIAFINHAFRACICISLCQDHQNLGIRAACVLASFMYGVGTYTELCGGCAGGLILWILSSFSIITAYLLFAYIFGKCAISFTRRCGKWDTNDVNNLAYFIGLFLVSIGSVAVQNSFKNVSTPLSVSLQIYLTSLFLIIIMALPCQIAKYDLRRLLHKMVEKEAFIRYISHEIRTPLNTVFLGMTFIKQELLLISPLVSEIVEPILDTVNEVNNCCEVALSIVNDLLTFDKLEEGKMSLELKETDIQWYVSETVKLFDISARDKKITIDIVPKDDESGWLSTLALRVDQHKMSQVIRNLISNAIKFTPEEGKIVVTMSLVDVQINNSNNVEIINNYRSLNKPVKNLSGDCSESLFDNLSTNLSKGNVIPPSLILKLPKGMKGEAVQNNYLRIEVKDSGAGISIENQKRLFGQYVQFNAGKLQHGNGSGLGLFISKGITELHGGWIGAFSEGEGKGSTFFLELPIFPKEKLSIVTSLYAVVASSSSSSSSLMRQSQRHQIRKESHSIHSVGIHPRANLSSNSPGISYSDVLSLDRKIRQRSGSEIFNMNSEIFDSNQVSQRTGVDMYSDVVGRMDRDEERSGKTLDGNLFSFTGFTSRKSSKLSTQLSMFVNSAYRVGCESNESEDIELEPNRTRLKPISLVGPCLKAREASPSNGSHVTPGIKILIVDDSMSTRKLLCKVLMKKGYQVQCAEDGLMCLRLVAQTSVEEAFDVIVMDDLMPNMTGGEAARILRERGYKGFICGVTGNTTLGDILAYETNGANTVLPKPLDLALFDKIVLTHMTKDLILRELT